MTKRFFRDNGLTIALAAAFLISLIGMIFAGWFHESEELATHGGNGISLGNYIVSGQFISAVFENWESEFLQMAFYVILTAYLFQRGSAESLDPDNPERKGDEIPAEFRKLPAFLRWLYSYSLGVALGALFVASFVIHWLASWRAANLEASLHGLEQKGAWAYLGDSQLWFESFQNWQSEFLSTGVLVVLSIFLRYRGSPESKPLTAAHAETGA